jgi:hypothetical protein
MKTSTLAFGFIFAAGFLFVVAKFLYLNGLVEHWFVPWCDMVGVVVLGSIVAVIYTRRKVR